jgi:hypothetical protein
VHTTNEIRWSQTLPVSLREERKDAAPEGGTEEGTQTNAERRAKPTRKAEQMDGTKGEGEGRSEGGSACVHKRENWSTTEELTTAFQSG